MGSKKNVDMSATEDTIKVVEGAEPSVENTETQEGEAVKPAKPKKKARARSGKYQAVRSQVDKTKLYDAFSAIELIKRLSYSKFSGSFEAHGVLKDTGKSAEITFPHSTGKKVKVEIVSDKLLEEIAEGKIEFDVLISEPKFMPKLAKHARVLGPKGLMPNPKNGTVTQDPEARKKVLEAGVITVKTEKKAPLIHVTFGKVDQDTKELVENLQTLIKAFKNDLKKLSISASMSPGVKVALDA